MKPSEEKSEKKESGKKDKNPSSQIPKGKTFLIILILFCIYSCGEKVPQEKKRNTIENINDDEDMVIKENL